MKAQIVQLSRLLFLSSPTYSMMFGRQFKDEKTLTQSGCTVQTHESRLFEHGPVIHTLATSQDTIATSQKSTLKQNPHSNVLATRQQRREN